MSNRTQPRQKKPNSNNSSNGSAQARPVDKSWKRTFTTQTNDDDEDEDGEFCVICAEPMKIQAVSKCNHPTCHKCTLRQRVLYEKKACVVCRSENEDGIFTEELGKLYSDLALIQSKNEKFGLLFTSEFVYHEVSHLLSYACQHCEFVGNNFKSLSDHIKQVHELTVCTICAAQHNQFPALIKTFTQKEFQTHSLKGDEHGFTGHPSCKFCRNKRFYSQDELNAHLKKDHEKCHVCEKMDPSNPQYFKDYDSLNDHFTSGHYKCPVQSCLDQKFIVFEDEFELQTHMAAEHSGIYGSSNLISTSNQRYRSQLSTFPGSVSSQPSSRGRIVNNSDPEPQDSLETKRRRLEERARHYLNYSAEDFKEFLQINKDFKYGHITAQELKLSYEKLFSQKNKQHTGGDNDIYLLIYELAHLFNKSSAEHTTLLAMYNQNERIVKQDEDFPALPGSSSQLMNGSWNANNKKKKQAKAAEDFPALPTANAAPKYTPVTTTVRYKTLTKPKPSVVKINRPSPTPSPPVRLNYLDTTAKPKTGTLVKPSAAKKLNDSQFPSLPAVPKKKIVIPRVNAIPTGSGVWGAATVGAPAAAKSEWPGLGGSNSGSGTSLNSFGDLNDSLPVVEGGKKKGKKGKQILFQMGGR